jgi:hypothetical protein
MREIETVIYHTQKKTPQKKKEEEEKLGTKRLLIVEGETSHYQPLGGGY